MPVRQFFAWKVEKEREFISDKVDVAFTRRLWGGTAGRCTMDDSLWIRAVLVAISDERWRRGIRPVPVPEADKAKRFVFKGERVDRRTADGGQVTKLLFGGNITGFVE